MHLASRWFTRLGFDQEVPDYSTFSKNRHGRFRQSGVFRKVFEEIMRRCLEARFVEGRNVALNGTLVAANASQQSRVPRERLAEAAKLSRTVQEYLAELERQNPVADSEGMKLQEKVSTTDPDATWAIKSGPAVLGYSTAQSGYRSPSPDPRTLRTRVFSLRAKRECLLFAELKQQIKLRKARLRRLWNVAERFYLAATAQNLKRLVRHLAQKQALELSTT